MSHEAILGRDIFAIDKYFKIYLKNALKQYDMNATEAMVLLVLYQKSANTKTQDQIIAELQYDKAAMTRTMQSLEKKNFVTRQNNPGDNRSYLFSVTEIAEDFKLKLFEILRAWNQLLLDNVENLEIVQKAINQMAQNAKQAVKESNL